MKKILSLIVVLILCFTITGCKDDKEKNNNNEQNISNNTNVSDTIINDNADEREYSFDVESMEDKIVFNFNNQYDMVFEFEGEKVSKYYWEYEYDTEEEAKKAETSYKDKIGGGDIIGVSRNGNRISIEMDKSNYEDSTRTELEETFNYLKNVSQGNV